MPASRDHNILDTASAHRPFLSCLGLAIWMGLALAAFLANWNDVFIGGDVYFADADCYSRMTRVRQVMAHPFQRIDHHAFENFPEGTDPHTTAPFDYAIAFLAWLLSPFSINAPDLAGAWISPLLGLATVAFLWGWSRRTPYAGAMLLLVAVSPIIVQAFKIGRPDHQSLTLLLIAIGLGSELSLWERPGRKWAVAWGLSWGLALWVTLYEPLILFLFLLILRFLILRKSALTLTWGLAWAVAAIVLGIGLLADGWRVSAQSPVVAVYFDRWSRLIGELAHVPPGSLEFVGWLGWLLPVVPVLLGWRFFRLREGVTLALLALLLATYGLTVWQLRWGCFFALVAAMAMPRALKAIPSPAAAWTLFAISLLPVAGQWDRLLFPDAAAEAAKAEQRQDYVLLREVANALVSPEETPVLAPWWLSPPLAYWSGQPCAGGSSHQSLPGTVDTARFYLATDPAEARRILDERQIKTVVAYEPDRVSGTSAILLGKPIPPNSIGATLYTTPHLAPPFLTLTFANAFFKVYEVKRP